MRMRTGVPFSGRMSIGREGNGVRRERALFDRSGKRKKKRKQCDRPV
ncbi:hypothetical protein [Methylacidimicrobium cyclopophantes]|nr:hypothetical protein [Methylacidimicrobium cyclopophantes]